MRRIHARSFGVIMLMAVVTFGLTPCYDTPVLVAHTSEQPVQTGASVWAQTDEPEGFVYYLSDGKAICRPATAEEAEFINVREVPLHQISDDSVSSQAAGDLGITLRATAQLEANAQAKATFLRAVAIWQSKLQTMGASITVIIDVDFGPTRFGAAFPSNVLGGTNPQVLGNSQGYFDVRNGLISRASNAQEMSLYGSLPATPLAVDIGNASGGFSSSAMLRELGVISPVADPAGEMSQFGPPPSTGFNSAFTYDFDPSNGITPGTLDFEGLAVHEIGHVLGFTSRVGVTELSPGSAPQVSPLDIFRFRPGATESTFGTALRILSSGGTQVFFAGSPELALSTGRQDGSGGDGFQAAHWKDSSFVGTPIGIMDPAQANGERSVITDNDVRAFDLMGYQPRVSTGTAPAINSVKASLSGDVVTLTGSVSDAQGDITQAQTSLLDSSSNVLVQNAPVSVSFGGQTTANYNLQITGLNTRPTATQARVVFMDGQGNNSSAGTSDFSVADPGGPAVNKVNYDPKLIVKGSGLAGLMLIEVNGVIVLTKDNGNEFKLKAGGSATDLNLRSGSNRVRVIRSGLHSNSRILTL